MHSIDQRPRRVAVPPPAPSWAGIGACTLPETTLADGGPAPVRLAYHLLALTTAGEGTVEVDFDTRRCRPGTLMWIRPGQAVRFGDQRGLDAALVSWDRDLLDGDQLAGLTTEDAGPSATDQLGDADAQVVTTQIQQLADDSARLIQSPVSAALLRHSLAVLVLRIVLLTRADPQAVPSAEARTFTRFRRALEEGHATSRRVEDYAEQLGCSVRTLTRASLAITGRTAKQVVDDRVALEARRLLACTDDSVAEVGRSLGFPEPTNFGRFFHREVGQSPGGFRAVVSGEDPSLVPAQRSPADPG